MSGMHYLNYSANLNQPNVYRDLINFFYEMLSGFNFDAGAIYLPNESNPNLYDLFYSVGFPELYCEKLATVVKGYGFGGTTAVLQTVRVSENTENDSRFALPIPFQSGFGSFISIPLMAEESMMGLLNFAYVEKVKFSLSKRESLLLLGRSLGLYLKVRLELQQALDQGRLFKKMYVLGTELFRINDLDHICNIALQESMVILDASCGFIALKSSKEVYARGVPSSPELLDEVVADIYKSKKRTFSNILIERSTLNSPLLQQFFEDNNLEQLYIAHLKIDDKLLGLLAFGQEHNQYKTFDMLALNQITQNLSMAIHKFYYNKTVKDRAVIKEYERISHELHDSLAQQFAAVMNRLEYFERTIAEKAYKDEISSDIREVKGMVYDASQDLRESISGLRLFSTDSDQPFFDMIEKLLERFVRNAAGMRLRTEIDLSDIRLSFDVQIQIIRIIQEALTNIRKHSHAQEVLLSLRPQDGKLLIVIRDDGVGFDLAGQSNGYGLAVMRERAQEIGADFEIQSECGEGTSITVLLTG